MRVRNPAEFSPDGYDYEVQQPPLGYIPYVITAQPNAPPKSAIVDMRWGGAIWVVVSAMLLLVLAILEELPLLGLTALLAISLLGPVEIDTAATVNNDAAAVAIGALGLIVLSLARRRGRSLTWLGLIVGVVIGLTKGLFVVVPAVFVVDAILQEGWHLISGKAQTTLLRSLWDALRRHFTETAMLVGAVLSFVGWTLFQSARATTRPSVVLHALMGFQTTSHLQITQIIRGVQQQFSVLIAYYPDAPIDVVWDIVVLGAIVGIVFLRTGSEIRPELRRLCIAVVTGLVALAVFWPTLVFIQGHYSFDAPARYALPLLPIIALILARSSRRIGLVAMGVLLPAAAIVWQLAIAKF